MGQMKVNIGYTVHWRHIDIDIILNWVPYKPMDKIEGQAKLGFLTCVLLATQITGSFRKKKLIQSWSLRLITSVVFQDRSLSLNQWYFEMDK